MPLKRAETKTKGGNNRTALIDGDVLVYSCGFASDIRTYTCPDGASFQYKKEAKEHCKELDLDIEAIETKVEAEPVENCLHSVKLMLKNIKEVCGTSKHKLYLTGRGNFRHDLPSPHIYKGNRKDAPKPIHYHAIRDYMVDTWGAISLHDSYLLHATGQIEGNYAMFTAQHRIRIVINTIYTHYTTQSTPCQYTTPYNLTICKLCCLVFPQKHHPHPDFKSENR